MGRAKAERLPRARMKGNSTGGKVIFTRFVKGSSLREEWSDLPTGVVVHAQLPTNLGTWTVHCGLEILGHSCKTTRYPLRIISQPDLGHLYLAFSFQWNVNLLRYSRVGYPYCVCVLIILWWVESGQDAIAADPLQPTVGLTLTS